MTGPVSRLALGNVSFGAARIGTIGFALAVGWVSCCQYRFAGV